MEELAAEVEKLKAENEELKALAGDVGSETEDALVTAPSEVEKNEAIVSKIKDCHKKGQPLLVFTSSDLVKDKEAVVNWILSN